MHGKNIITFGEFLWDVFPKSRHPGGAPFNVACHLSAFGHNPQFITSVGTDKPGTAILAELESRGLSGVFVQKNTTYPTGRVMVQFDSKGEPNYTIATPSAWDYIATTTAMHKASGNASAIIFGSLAQRTRHNRESLARLLDNSRFRVFDVNLRPPFTNRTIVENSLRRADLVKLNSAELVTLSSWFALPDSEKAAAVTLAEKFDCQTVCVTRGQNGSAIWHRHSWTERPGCKPTLTGTESAEKDSVGAGDAFLAALVDGLLANKSAEEILAFANAAGAWVAGSAVATPQLDRTQIERLIAL
jgi:fructokinase